MIYNAFNIVTGTASLLVLQVPKLPRYPYFARGTHGYGPRPPICLPLWSANVFGPPTFLEVQIRHLIFLVKYGQCVFDEFSLGDINYINV